MQPPEDWRARLARRAESDSFFMASALAAYSEQEGVDQLGLAAWLGCSVETLGHLALCRRPETDGPSFRTAVQQISAHTGIDPGAIVRLLRAVEAVEALSGPGWPAGGSGQLMAARDRQPSDEPPAVGEPEGDKPLGLRPFGRPPGGTASDGQ